MKPVTLLLIVCIATLLSACKSKPDNESNTIAATEQSSTVSEDQATDEQPAELSNTEFFDKAISSDTLTLVDFYATWCGPCKQMHPVLERLSEMQHHHVKVVKVDTDKYPELAERYNIQAIPTLILFKRGKQEWSNIGVISYEELRNVVEAY